MIALAGASCGDAVTETNDTRDGTGGATAIEISDAEPPPPAEADTVTTITNVDDTATPITEVEADPEITTTTTATTTTSSTTTTTAPPTTPPPTTVAPQPPPPPRPADCVRADIDFAAVRSGATTSADKIAEIAAGACGVAFTGEVAVVDTAGEMWVAIDLGDRIGWSAARLFDVATLGRDIGLTVAFSQITNSITGGVGGPIVTDQLRAAPGRTGAVLPWGGGVDSCGTGDSVVCTWFSSDDNTEVFIDVRLIFGNRGWVIDAVASGSCGGQDCGGLR